MAEQGLVEIYYIFKHLIHMSISTKLLMSVK